MKPETEKFLERLSNEFVGVKAKSKKRAKKPRKLNHRVLLESLSDGSTLSQAAKDAGSTAKTVDALRVSASQVLDAHPEYKEPLTDMIEEKQRKILKAMSQEKIEDASLTSQAVAFGILTDKGELLAGRPTQRNESNVDLSPLDRVQLLSFILGRLSSGSSTDKG